MIECGNQKLTLGLSMLVKDETDLLEKCFQSLQPCREAFEEIVVGWTGTNPETKAILDRYATRILPVEWKFDHGAARQEVYDAMTTDLVMWLDADDELGVADPEVLGLIHPLPEGELQAVIQQAFANPAVGSLWLDYLYSFDEHGNLDSIHKRERVVRREWFKWVGALHENLLVKDIASLPAMDERAQALQVKHGAPRERQIESGKRCLEIARKQIEREQAKGEIDPRTIYDWARALQANGLHQEAIQQYEDYIKVCGWDDMRYCALNLMADIHRMHDRYELSKQANHMAIIMKPKWPEAYYGLAKTSFREHQWPDVLHWCQVIKNCERPAGVIPTDPTVWTTAPLKLMHHAFFQMGDFPKAQIVAEEALRWYPNDASLRSSVEAYRHARQLIRLQGALVEVKEWLETHDESHKLQHLIQAVPQDMADEPTFVRLRNQLFPPRSKNRIVIYCGKSYEKWGPFSVKEGIGGSEEAVIYLAPLLAAKGWTVDVYGYLDQEVQVQGVNWKPYHTWDPQFDRPDIFIAWRVPEMIERFAPPRPTRCFLWAHDVVTPDSWNPARIERLDHLLVLSRYHRTFFPMISEEKIIYTRNGIVLDDFLGHYERDAYRCVYMSSPDRGLDILLRGWGDIKKAHPQATLGTYYGFTKNFDEKHRGDYSKIAYKNEMLALLQQDGIEYLGRRPHGEIARACLTGGLWTYPCIFSEISCISAMKAQAGGLVPVVNNYAALAETVQHGIRMKPDGLMEKDYIQAVIAALSEPQRIEAMREPMRVWAHEQFGWEGVAEQWHAIFEGSAVPVVV